MCDHSLNNSSSLTTPEGPRHKVETSALNTWRTCLEKVSEISGLDPLNLELVRLLKEKIKYIFGTESQHDIHKFKQVCRFLILNRSYCSPLSHNPYGLIQDGILRLPGDLKYMRSEINTPVFGLKYDRNQVLIRSCMQQSFIEGCSVYINPSALGQKTNLGKSYLNDNIPTERQVSNTLLVIDLSETKASELISYLAKLPVKQSSVVYLRSSTPVSEDLQAQLKDFVSGLDQDLSIILQQPFIVDGKYVDDIDLISLIDCGKYKFRYQALQDLASMGYRPYLSECLSHFEKTAKLPELLVQSLESQNETEALSFRSTYKPEAEDLQERLSDLKLIRNILCASRNSLPDFDGNTLLSDIAQIVRNQAAKISSAIQKEVDSTDISLPDSASIFHRAYNSIRTISQYCAFLKSLGEKSTNPQEGWGEENCAGVIATSSGMTAIRNIVFALRDKVEKVYSTKHYWEFDFLLENIFSGNPHFPQTTQPNKTSSLTTVPNQSSQQDLIALVDQIVACDKKSTSGQLVCLDQSIASFFFTKNFPLKEFCELLASANHKFSNPVYLVIDNTLDFFETTPSQLFPKGIPDNLIIIDAASHAKLHQLGFDVVTGGMLRVHSNPASKDAAVKIASEIAKRVQAEDSGQSLYGQHLIDTLFYKTSKDGNPQDIIDFMVRKRHRNTKIFFDSVRNYFEDSSTFKFEDSFSISGQKPLDVPNSKIEGLRHNIDMNLHFSTQSALHVYLRINEADSDQYVAGQVFEKLKSRVLESCYQEGILIGDGTSWGLRNTRIDWYMHTLRVAIGVEHRQTIKRIGELFAEALLDFKNNPETFMRGRSIVLLSPRVVLSNKDEINSLLRQIPHDPKNFEDIDSILQSQQEAAKYSLIMIEAGKAVGLIVAYPLTKQDGSKSLYISKAVTADSIRGTGGFSTMLNQLKKSALRRNLNTLELNTSASKRNENIVRIYEHHGFVSSKDLLISWQSDGWPLVQVQMQKDLSKTTNIQEQEKFQGLPSSFYEKLRKERQSGIL